MRVFISTPSYSPNPYYGTTERVIKMDKLFSYKNRDYAEQDGSILVQYFECTLKRSLYDTDGRLIENTGGYFYLIELDLLEGKFWLYKTKKEAVECTPTYTYTLEYLFNVIKFE